MSFQRSIVLLLLGLVSASGQQPGALPSAPAPPPGVPIPGFVPPPFAGAPAPNQFVPQPAVPLGETKITTDINEPKLSGAALAGLYRKYTGRRVIVSAAAAAVEFAFIQEATPQDPLTFAQAAELLKKAATIENFVFVPDDEDPNLDILTAASGIRPTGRGVAVYNENDTLPEGDAVISYVMTLSFIKPAEAVNTFTQIVGQLGAYGSIAPVPNASAVVITENTSLIRKLIDLKKKSTSRPPKSAPASSRSNTPTSPRSPKPSPISSPPNKPPRKPPASSGRIPTPPRHRPGPPRKSPANPAPPAAVKKPPSRSSPTPAPTASSPWAAPSI